MTTRGIRGATTVQLNGREEILSATKELLQKMIADNSLKISDIASAFFSLTADLDAEFPALAVRELGWEEVPLLCMREIPVPGSLPLCIRVLLLVNTGKEQSQIKNVYLRAAVDLRR
jgi:chorismate mutase